MDYLSVNLEKVGMAPALREALESYQLKEPVSVRMKNGGGLEMSYKGVSLYHPEQPLAQAAAEVNRLQGDSDQDLVVFFGLGFGIHAEFLKKRFNSPLIVFDPSLDIIKQTLTLRPLELGDFTIESSFGRLAEIVDRRLELSDRRLIVAMHSSYRQLFPKEIERFKFVVQQAAHNVIIRHNTLARGSTWAKFEIENLKDTVEFPPVTELKNFAKGVPGIFVGAGPSLSKNIQKLKDFRGKAVIIAAATALKPLDKAGIRPDVAMVIESNSSTHQFDGVSCLNQLTLAPTPYSHPDNFKIPVRRKMSLLNHPTPSHDWMTRAYGHVDSVLTAGSVALAAFSTLHRIGCDPIIALGMDLAFTGDQTHASNADSAAIVTRYNVEKQQIEYVVMDPESPFVLKFVSSNGRYARGDVFRTRDALPCEGWGDAEGVYSDATFTAYRAWLEGAADTWAGDRKLINATEGGARIIGFEEMTLAEAVEKHAHKNAPVDTWIDDIFETHIPRDLSPLRTEIDKELQLIRRVRQLAEQSRILATQTVQLIHANKINKAQRKLDSLGAMEKEMGALSRETRVLNQISQRAATNIRLKRHEDENEDILVQTVNSLKRSGVLFGEIKNGCDEAMALFEQAIKNLADNK